MTQRATKLKYTNNKRLNWISRQSPFETFSNLQGNKLWKAQPNHDSPRATSELKVKCYHSCQKISQPISSQKSFVTSQKLFFLPLPVIIYFWDNPSKVRPPSSPKSLHFEYQPSSKGGTHRLQCLTTCKIQNGRQGAPKWPTGSEKGSTPSFLGAPVSK